LAQASLAEATPEKQWHNKAAMGAHCCKTPLYCEDAFVVNRRTYDSSEGTTQKVSTMPPPSKTQGSSCPSACMVDMSHSGRPSVSSMFCKDPFVADGSKSVLYDTGSYCSFASHEDVGFWKLAQTAETLSQVQSHNLRGNLKMFCKAAPLTSPHLLMAAAEYRVSMLLADQVCCTCMSNCSEVELAAASDIFRQGKAATSVEFKVSPPRVPAAAEAQLRATSGKRVRFAPHPTEVLLTDKIATKGGILRHRNTAEIVNGGVATGRTSGCFSFFMWLLGC